MKAQFQITIPKRSQSCMQCNKPFAPNQEIHSQVVEGEEEWIRQDACVECFSPIENAAKWKQVIDSNEKIVPENRDHIEKLLELLQKLIESEAASDHEEAFLLALYLVRKKVLVHRVRMGLYENAETGDMFLVPKIDFSHFSAHATQLRLQEKL
jgi:hypothetical protein